MLMRGVTYAFALANFTEEEILNRSLKPHGLLLHSHVTDHNIANWFSPDSCIRQHVLF
jgi:hypothetical protein